MYKLFIYSLISAFIADYLMQKIFQKRIPTRKPLSPKLLYGIVLVLYLFTYYKVNGHLVLFILESLILLFLVMLSLIDYATFELPNLLILCVGILGLFDQLVLGNISFMSLITGFFAASLLLLLIGLISGGNMGGGDIKLAAACGLWLGPVLILLGLFLAVLLAGCTLSILLLLKQKTLKNQVAFGPYLAIGFAIAHFYGWSLLHWYFQLF